MLRRTFLALAMLAGAVPVCEAQVKLERKLKAYEQKALAALADELAAKAAMRDGLKIVSAVVTASDQEALRALGAQVLAKLGEGVVQLGAALGNPHARA